MTYTVIGYAHQGIGQSNVSIEKETYQEARDEVDNLLSQHAIISYVVVLDEKGVMVSKHY